GGVVAALIAADDRVGVAARDREEPDGGPALGLAAEADRGAGAGPRVRGAADPIGPEPEDVRVEEVLAAAGREQRIGESHAEAGGQSLEAAGDVDERIDAAPQVA